MVNPFKTFKVRNYPVMVIVTILRGKSQTIIIQEDCYKVIKTLNWYVAIKP